MGFNFRGLATLSYLPEVVAAFESGYGLMKQRYSVVYEKDVFFEEILTRKDEDNIMDIYTSPLASIVSFSYGFDRNFDPHELSKYMNFETFEISETSMSHRFALYKDGKTELEVNIWDTEKGRLISGENYLDITDTEDIVFGPFGRLAAEYLGEDIHGIDVGLPVKRFKLTPIRLTTL